jgi:hypothetical protein
LQNKSQKTIPRKGMIRNTPYLQQGEYSLAVNMVSEALDGNRYTLLRETSNILSFILPLGYKIIGYDYSLIKEKLYLAITNPDTKFSSIGYVNTLSNLNSIEDSEIKCTNCDYFKILETPLELQNQVPYLTYVELLNDNCSGNFNFDINFPIKFSELKEEKSGTIWYITDYYNPPRNIQLDNIQQYLQKQEPCSDVIIPICVDVDKMRIFPNNLIPEIKPEVLQIGGNLPEGTYEFLIAYSNLIGDEISEYYSITNPLKLFDENNLIKNQRDQNDTTNYGIRLKIKNLDLNYRYYKVVAIQRTDVSGTTSYFEVGVYPTTNNTILYTSTGIQDKEENIGGVRRRTTLEKINAIKPKIELSRGLVSSGDKLFHWGLVRKKEINLQPIMQFIGANLKWNTSIAKETLYNNPIATSNYGTYNREEVQPFGLRTLHKDGSKSAIFPLIPPPLRDLSQPIVEGSNSYTNEGQILSSSDTNLKAILKNAPSCTESSRTKVWQIYNTAEEEGDCDIYTPSSQTIPEKVLKTCTIFSVDTIVQNSTTIELDTPFTTLKDYIEDNYEEIIDPLSDKYILEIAPYLVNNYPLINCTPNFSNNCDTPILESSKTTIGDISLVVPIPSLLQIGKRYIINNLVVGDDFSNVGFIKNQDYFVASGTTPNIWSSTEVLIEDKTLIEANFPTDYEDTILKNTCNIYAFGDNEGVSVDSRANPDTQPTQGNPYISALPCGQYLVVRDFQFQNLSSNFADSIQNITSSTSNNYLQNYFNNYDFSQNLSDLLGTKSANPIASGWYPTLHKQALWFKTETTKDKFIFEITPQKTVNRIRDNVSSGQSIRVSLYKTKTATSPFYTFISDLTFGSKLLFEKVIGGFNIKDESSNPPVFVSITSGKFYVAVDCKIVLDFRSIILNNIPCINTPTADMYRIAPTDGCYSIVTRDIEYSKAIVNWQSIQINKTETYNSNCTYNLPKLNDCNPIPFKYGKFAYYESIETYPDNKELYDSSNFIVKVSDLTTLTSKQKEDFDKDFKQSINNNTYVLKSNTNLRCTPVRHYKMPSNKVAPFMTSDLIQDNSQSAIYPLGVSLDSNVVKVFLDIAKNNNLITQEERDNIVGYEILKADNSLHKSIVAKGILYDMYSYDDSGKKTLYSNYPHNDLGQDIFNFERNTQTLIQHPYEGVRNNNFTILSPDLTNKKPSLPQEIIIDGYQYGSTIPYFEDVLQHPRWVVMNNRAKDTANILAIAEQVLETIINITNFTTQSGIGHSWFVAGIGSTGTNAVGTGFSTASILAFGASQALNGIIKIGQKRLEWLRIIRNLGQPTNHASLCLSDGYMNKFSPNIEYSEILRGISTKKYLRGDKYLLKDENNGETFRINNKYREFSAFLSLGKSDIEIKENFINYPPDYINYDNNTRNQESSKNLFSQNNNQSEGRNKNIASPYVTLKNWIPNQFGTLDSINWLTTNYTASLEKDTTCDIVYGGTVVISRMTEKRKFPHFRTTAMQTADLSPFKYTDYPNVGSPRFYCDYEINATDGNFGAALFPTIESSYVFDSEKKDGMYMDKQSRFYMHSYGLSNFLVESEINLNARYARPELKDQFYNTVSDKLDWVQEANLSINEPNTFFYNDIYSQQVSKSIGRTLPSNYSKKEFDIQQDSENGVIYSNVDSDENSFYDPWLIYKEFNFKELKKKYGKLIQLKGIESDNILARFENGQLIFNTADLLTSQNNSIVVESGSGSVFDKRPTELRFTDLGFQGTQHSDMISTPYGHFTVDAKRGQVFLNNDVISDFIGGKDSGMKSWFREQLPFKILKQFPEIDIDNKFKGIGISMGYDNRLDRILLTKKDYIVINTNNLQYDNKIGFFITEVNNKIPINYNNKNYFEDVSWTLSYNFVTNSWESYHDYKPNLYFSFNNYFQTFLNYSKENLKNGTSWSHLLTNRSYSVFYGDKFPSWVEMTVMPNGANNILNSISINTQSRRYQNNFDYSEIKNKGFTSVVISNSTNSSGKLKLFPELTFQDRSKYPITDLVNNEQSISYTDLEGLKTFNYFYNRRINDDNLQPLFLNDKSQIKKSVNKKSVTFRNLGTLDRLRGQYFTLLLEDNSDTRFQTLLNFVDTEQKLY